MAQIESRRLPRRIAPLPFTLAVAVVYLLSFGSQMLLAPPATGVLGIVPFALFQAVLIGAWFVLHKWRLQDAGRPTGIALGIAAVYAIEVVLLVTVVALMLGSAAGTTESAGSESSILQLFVILYLFSLLAGDPTLGALQIWIAGFMALLLIPVAVAVIFSGWTATRPSVP